jgi:hypothetical protein
MAAKNNVENLNKRGLTKINENLPLISKSNLWFVKLAKMNLQKFSEKELKEKNLAWVPKESIEAKMMSK